MPVWLWLLIWVALLTAGVAVYVLQPVWRQQSLAVSAAERRRSELLARRETLLTALRELDLDYAVGKIPEDEYQERRTAWLREGARLLRELDRLEQELAARPAQAPSEAAAQARIEALLEQRRRERTRAAITEQGVAPEQAARQVTLPAGDDMVEDLLLARRRQRRARFVGFCPHCGAPFQQNDRFCGKCGRPLHDTTTSRRKRRK